MLTRTGNLVTAVLKGEVDTMMHVVNSQCTMDTGIAKQVKDRIPEVFKLHMEYPQYVGGYSTTDKVFNLYAIQNHKAGDKRIFNYGYFSISLFSLFDELEEEGFIGTIGVPYLLGTDKEGGDWDVIFEILESISDYYGIKLILYKEGD